MVSTTKKKCKSMQKSQKVANVSSTATTKMQEVQSIGPHQVCTDATSYSYAKIFFDF